MKSKDLPVIEDPKPLQMITLENSTKYDAHRKSPQKILNARTRTQRLQKHTQFNFAHTHTQRQPTHTLPTTHTTKNIRNKRNTPHTHTTQTTHTTQHPTHIPHNTHHNIHPTRTTPHALLWKTLEGSSTRLSPSLSIFF